VLYLMAMTRKAVYDKSLILLVGTARFELATPCTPCKCATRLRHVPTGRAHAKQPQRELQSRFPAIWERS
jgi:hypothetical protein